MRICSIQTKSLILALLLALVAAVSPAVAKMTRYVFEHAGRSRRYRLHVPPQCVNKPVPLLIVLHGAAADYKLIENVSGMSPIADREGFLVAYANGTGILGNSFVSWNSGDCCGFAKKRQIDDIGFVSRLIDHVAAHNCVDLSRVYIVGFSNGGMLAYQLAAPLSNRIAAMGVIQGSMTGREKAPSQPVPLLAIHGTNDWRVPYKGGRGRFARLGLTVNDKPFAYTVDFWKNANRCTPLASVSRPTPSVIREEYQPAIAGQGAPVVAYTLIGGQHSWPGGKRSRLWGPTPSKELNASQIIWDFVSAHKRASAVAGASVEAAIQPEVSSR